MTIGSLINNNDSSIKVGYGKSFASFGEIIQGKKSDGTDFLVTLPIDMWSICNITCLSRPGPTVINCNYDKSKDLAHRLIEKLELTEGYELNISFSRNIPVGKGLSSSTADMLSTARALQELFGFILSHEFISKVFIEIEPHDALHYKSSVLYNHRKGELLEKFNYIPKYTIIFVDNGGQVDTVQYNEKIIVEDAFTNDYDKLVKETCEAFNKKNDRLIAKCATASAELFLRQNENHFVAEAVNYIDEFNALGLINTHSGTCIGYIYDDQMSDTSLELMTQKIANKFNKPTSITKSLTLLA